MPGHETVKPFIEAAVQLQRVIRVGAGITQGFHALRVEFIKVPTLGNCLEIGHLRLEQ